METTTPQAPVPQTPVPETRVPQAPVPQTSVPQTPVPQAAVAHTPVSARLRQQILKRIRTRSFCTIATTSAARHSHSAGVVYAFADDALWVHTLRSSRKARNIDSNSSIGVCIPFRRLPVGPPYTVHFQANAELVAMDDDAVAPLLQSGALKAITGHGALEMDDGCFIRITPKGTVHSFGPGASMIDLIRDPLTTGARSFRYDQAAV